MFRVHRGDRASAILVLCVASAAAAQSAPRAQPSPSQVFESFRLALMLRDANASLRFVDPAGLRHYDRLLRVAQSGRDTRSLPLSYEERALISAVRNFAPPEVVGAKSCKVATRRALANPRYATSQLQDVTLADLRTKGDRATAAIRYRKQPTPFNLRFVRRDGSWHLSRVQLHAGFVRVLETLGVPPEVDAATLERARTLWALVVQREGRL